MKSIMKKKLLPSMMAALAAGVGFSGSVQAIELAEDGTGQLLLAPMYWAGKVGNVTGEESERDYKTEFALVNTRQDTAVKVKVVFRSQVASTECLDFICYMSPGDVCRFDTRDLGNGETGVYSTDDSVKVQVDETEFGIYPNRVDSLAQVPAVFASQKPFSVAFRPLRLGEGDTCDVGHVEIFGAYGVQNRVVGYQASGLTQFVDITRPMSKYELAKVFDTPRTPADTAVSQQLHRAVTAQGDGENTTNDLTLALANNHAGIVPAVQMTAEEVARQSDPATSPLTPLPVTGAPNIRSTDPTWVQLMGTATIITNEDRFSYDIPALDATLPLGPFIVPDSSNLLGGTPTIGGVLNSQAMFDGLVVSSPRYDVSIAVENGLGGRQGVRPVNNTYPGAISNVFADKLVEIEEALATAATSGLYDNSDNKSTYLIQNLPTRYRHSVNNPCAVAGWSAYFGDLTTTDDDRLFSPPFSDTGAMAVTINQFDDFENLTERTGGIIVSPTVVETEVLRLVETNYFQPSWSSDFVKGWYQVIYNTESGCPYSGAPVLGLTHNFIGSPSTQSVANTVTR